jgi:undecaprenyl-diphosphatase
MPFVDSFDRFFLRALYAAGEESRWLHVVSAITFLGSGWMLALLLPAFFRRGWRASSGALLATVVATSGVVASVKAIVGRIRPCQALDWIHPITSIPTDPSFPSGHAAGSFAFAAFLLATRRRTGIALLLLAAAVAASRVALGVHYPSDVVAGALLGGTLGAWGARLHERYALRESTHACHEGAAPIAAPIGVDPTSPAVDWSDADPKAVR